MFQRPTPREHVVRGVARTIGDPVMSSDDVLSKTPSPDESSGSGDYLDEDDDSARMMEDPLPGRPTAT
jgi:hypothetical protein